MPAAAPWRKQGGAAEPASALPTTLRRWLWCIGVGSLLWRACLASAFPVTGDEAFFYWWGVYPRWGYSDHPPMVGWWIAAMRALAGDSLLSIRLPAVWLPLVAGAALGWALAPLDRVRAAAATLLIWLAPLNWLNMLITTDTPLVFWSLLSAAVLLRADQRPRLDALAWTQYGVAGLLWSCAFLSKYFAVVLALAYAVHAVGWRRDRWRAYALMAVCALPGPLINLWWNMAHGWPNIMFNLYNRHDGAHFAWRQPLLYGLCLAYLLSPPALWLAWRQRREWAAWARTQPLLACLVVVPLLFFALLSTKKVIGLHWLLSFYPFALMALAWVLSPAQLKRCVVGMALLAAVQVLLASGLALTRVSDWQGTPIYPGIVRSFEARAILQKAEAPGAELMADAYTPAAIYGFVRRRYMPVFGVGRFHARQDDLWVDFARYRGRTIRVLHASRPDLASYKPYFSSVQLSAFEQSGHTFYVVEGRGFDDEAYRAGVLREVYRRYYQMPGFLPVTGCPFCKRLCSALRCSF